MQKFKIVQTIEKGEYKLSAVPDSWEHQGILRWPRVKWEKLRRDPYSTPEDNWRSINCILKRKNIMSYQEAEAELSAMSDVTDTDQENVTQNIPSKPQNKEKDFNKLALHCFETQAQIHTSPSISKNRFNPNKSLQTAMDSNQSTLSKNYPRMDSEIREYLVFPSANGNSKPEEVQPVQVQAYEYEDNIPEVENFNSDILITHAQQEIRKEFGEQPPSMTKADVLMAATKELSVKLTTLETRFDNFVANQIIITQNQEQIMQKLSEISVQFEEFIKRSSAVHSTRTEDSNKGFINISNEQGLNEFEELLKDREDEMTEVFSVVCGQGKGRALNNAYALSEVMFDRKFLNQCSWSGGSRGETSKICFKSYKRTINFFFKMIHASDRQFTTLECESFFKNILRHSKKRCESKQLKRSAQKIRQKKEKYENKENEGGSVSEENSEHPPIKEIKLANQELEDKIVNAEDLLFQETEV